MSGKEHQFRKKVSSEPPKRPMSAYFLFLKDVRAGLFKNNPGSSVAEVSKIAGEKWRNIDPTSKSEYQKQAQEIKLQYEIQKADYESIHGAIVRQTKRRRGIEHVQKKDGSFKHLRAGV